MVVVGSTCTPRRRHEEAQVKPLSTWGLVPAAPTTAEPRRIAGLVGPTRRALSASEALNCFQIWEENLAPVIKLDGALLFVSVS
jgi:hypothetical protein